MTRSLTISPFRVVLLFASLALLGLSVLPRLSLQLYPAATEAQLRISFAWPQATPDQVERDATAMLEGSLSRVEGLAEMRSVSGLGYGTLELTFKEHISLEVARFRVSNLLRQVADKLPPGVSYPRIAVGGAHEQQGPLMTLAVRSVLHPRAIQSAIEDRLLDRLRQVDGMDEVRLNGVPPFAWQVTLDQEQLAALGLSPTAIARQLQASYRSTFMGFVQGLHSRAGASRQALYLSLPPQQRNALERLPVGHVAGKVICLADVARLDYREQEPREIYRINGLNTITLTLHPEAGANHLVLAQTVETLLAEVPLPEGLALQTLYDSTVYLRQDLRKLQIRSLASVALLLVLLLLVTRQWRYLLTVLLSLLANLLLAALFFWWLGLSIHLYSLAGITLAFGFIIDNTIIMVSHLRRHGNTKAFASIFGATLTTLVVVGLIFLLPAEQRQNLDEFSLAIGVCLVTSLLVAFGLVPGLARLFGVRNQASKRISPGARRVVHMLQGYWRVLRTLGRVRWGLFLLLIPAIGIPFHLLPDALEGDSAAVQWYNTNIGSEKAQERIARLTPYLGGVWAMFDKEVFEGRVVANPKRLSLRVVGQMQEGASLSQMDGLIRRMESFISQYDAIETFQTTINSPQQGIIEVFFYPEVEYSSVPYLIKADVEVKALSLGGADWTVTGVGQGFSNAMHDGLRTEQVILKGYQYEQLYALAEELGAQLEQLSRVEEVEIRGALSLYQSAREAQVLTWDAHRIAQLGVPRPVLLGAIQEQYVRQTLPARYYQGSYQPVLLAMESDVGELTLWDLMHLPVATPDGYLKLSHFAGVETRSVPHEIYKYNQAYTLGLAFDFNGPQLMAKNVIEAEVEAFSADLPLGFSAYRRDYGGWQADEMGQYLLLLAVLAVVFLICGVLFESLRLPLAIISLIPVSFIGAFLSYVYFDWPFDQGGFAAFLFLGGMVVNAGIYITVAYQQHRQQHSPHRALQKAIFQKCYPILLTLLTTVMGLIPFVWGDRPQPFWSAFAIGTLGGLLSSLFGVFVLLPLVIGVRRKPRPKEV